MTENPHSSPSHTRQIAIYSAITALLAMTHNEDAHWYTTFTIIFHFCILGDHSLTEGRSFAFVWLVGYEIKCS